MCVCVCVCVIVAYLVKCSKGLQLVPSVSYAQHAHTHNTPMVW